MIHYLVRERHTYTIRRFLDSWGSALRDVVEVVPYEVLFRRAQASAGVYVFADLERLTAPEKRLASDVFERLTTAGSAFRALNHPRHALTRFQLLTALADQGVNHYRAYRRVDLRGVRYPVFVRTASEHEGSLTPLLRSRRDLPGALARLMRHPLRLRAGLLVVEFEDTRDATGLFRKYSAMRIGDALIPRHVLASRRWVVKMPDVIDAATVREEAAFMRDFPHEEQVRRVFDLAHIDYGRIDYSVRGDRIVVWEINTNPILVPEPEGVHPDRLEYQSRSAARIIEAFQCLAGGTSDGPPISIFGRDDRKRIWTARVARRISR